MQSNSDFQKLCETILAQGYLKLGLSLGVVGKITGKDYLVTAVRDQRGVFRAGETFKLKGTYCQEMIDKPVSLAVPHKDKKRALKSHPLYNNIPLEAYICAPIFRDQKLWGTLNYSDFKPGKSFNDDDLAFIQRLADALTKFITQYDAGLQT